MSIIETGIGDDAAVLNLASLCSEGVRLLVSTDTLSQGTHFLPDADPKSLGFKALAVNISDILAMGGVPVAFTLCITLPAIHHSWLEQFSAGLREASHMYGNISLIGGDTTRGPLSMSLQIFGTSTAQPLLRSTAHSGDMIVVTGSLGDSAAGLQLLLEQSSNRENSKRWRSQEHYLIQRHCKPIPRQGFTSDIDGLRAAIDISDGFLFDLEHICRASDLKAIIEPNRVPLSAELQFVVPHPLHFALVGGEDYELCLVCHPATYDALQVIAQRENFRLSMVGFMQDKHDSEQLIELQGWSTIDIQRLKETGFDHFKR